MIISYFETKHKRIDNVKSFAWNITGSSNMLFFPVIPMIALKIMKCYYENMPMKYTAIFHGCKKDNFQMKKFDVFHIFAQNIDCGYTLEPPQ